MAKKPKAVVIGVGAERGIGAPLSRRFAKEGYHVLVAGRTAAKIDKVVDDDPRGRRLGHGGRRRRHQGSRGRRAVRQGDGRRRRRRAGRSVRLQHGQQRRRRFSRDDGRALRGFLAGRLLRRLPVRPRGDAPAGAARPRHGDLHRRLGLAARPAAVRGLQRHQGRACGCWSSRWRASSGRRASMSRTSSSTAASKATACCRACPTAPRRPARTGCSRSRRSPTTTGTCTRQQRSAWTHEIDLRPYKETF